MRSKTWVIPLRQAGMFGLALTIMFFSLFPAGVAAARPMADALPALHAAEPLQNFLFPKTSSINLPQATGDENWQAGFHLPGVNGDVYALAMDSQGNLYAGGSFTMAGGVPVKYVARWDGASWSPLGDGFNNRVWALAVGPDDTVYASGDFILDGGAGLITYNRIARWDGSAWQPMATGMSSSVYALAYGPDGRLYAGGQFTQDGSGTQLYNLIVYWEDDAWHNLGAGISNNAVRALAFDGSGGLLVGGTFTDGGGVAAADRVARWSSTGGWEPLGVGIENGGVYALAWDGANIFAGGNFTKAGGLPASGIAIWDGAGWSALGDGVNGYVYALQWDGGGLFVGGSFTLDGSGVNPYSRVAYWSGGGWTALEYNGVNGVNNAVRTLLLDGAGDLWLGGVFDTAGGITVDGIARWDGAAWSSTGQGLDGAVYALVWDGLDSFYAGGDFTHAGGVPANRVARWDGVRWHALGSGMEETVRALALDDSGNLYAGGDFLTADGAAANHVAYWNGSFWQALGGGINNVTSNAVNALAFDPVSDVLYAGGNFLNVNAGSIPANRVAQWNGASWTALGPGVDNTVRALALDGAGDLVVGGDFIDTGDDATRLNYVGRWDGANWLALGGSTVGVNGSVRTLAFDPGGKLYVGGAFTSAGGMAGAGRVASWDGAAWGLLGSGVNGLVNSIAFGEMSIFVGGDFDQASGVSANRIAEWNDGEWLALGSGTNVGGVVYALAPNGAEGLYAAGVFSTAGLKPAVRFGYWTMPNFAPTARPDAYSVPEDLTLLVGPPGVLENDIDRNQDPITATLQSVPGLGDLVLNANGALTYTAPLDYHGVITFSYIASDGVLTSTAQVTITVTPVNDAPSALDDNFVGVEDEVLEVAAPGVLENDGDLDGDTLSALQAVIDPAFGMVSLDPNGHFLYTPSPDLSGLVTFTYTASDGVLTDTAVVSIQLSNANDSPLVNAGAPLTATEGAEAAFAGTYSDPDGDAASAIHWDFGDETEAFGTLAPSHIYQDNGVFTATLTITDPTGASGSDWLLVTVDNVAPAILPVEAPSAIHVGQALVLIIRFTDPGISDTHEARIDWAVNAFQTVYINRGTRQFTVQYVFTEADEDHPVRVRITDSDQDFAEITLTIDILPNRVLLPIVQR